MQNEKLKLKPGKLILDILLLNCIGWPIYFLNEWSEPFKRGFFCEDTSLQFPLVESSTIPGWAVYYLAGIGGVCGIITITEFLARPRGKQDYSLLCLRIPNWIYNLYCVIGVYAYGAVFTRLTVNVLKLSGILRPTFLTLCKPDVCKGQFPPFQYHEEYTCTDLNYQYRKSWRFSFPSGHSTISMYMMIFLALYLQKRVSWSGSKLLKHFLQSVALLFSLFVGVTRVGTYKHHGSDVICGWIIGGVIALHFSSCKQLGSCLNLIQICSNDVLSPIETFSNADAQTLTRTVQT
ncbi:unnamed protein product [Phaedon cochleariae]|uniref:Phosphatidic acid phosphatase type 2/haloperoxidase domain-containing protein n=1 Tax=Phaedon cochleariae TaxID=80249 RepID=A0A9N9SB80_PHACE|nr:unnamed protein product [Phaedon cochleariae]